VELQQRPLLALISAAAVRPLRSGAFEAQGLANISWSFATLLFRDAPLMEVIAQAALAPGVLPAFTPQALANTSWAFAMLWIQHEPLLDAIAAAALCNNSLSGFAAQEVANTAWAFAALRYHHEALFDSIAVALTQSTTLRQFSAQQIANTAWSFATLDCLDQPLLDALSARALSLIPTNEFGAQALVTMSWAMARSRLSAAGACPEAAHQAGHLASASFDLLVAFEEATRTRSSTLVDLVRPEATGEERAAPTSPYSLFGPAMMEGEQLNDSALELAMLGRFDGLEGFSNIGSISRCLRSGTSPRLAEGCLIGMSSEE